MKTDKILATAFFLTFSTFLLKNPLPVKAESCTALMPVGGNTTKVTKTASQPTIPLVGPLGINDDWNTDFIVPSNATYKSYLVTLIPQDAGEYSIRMYLKYSNNTADNFYDQQPTLIAQKPLMVKGKPRVKQQPYQVNVFVGDAASMGKTYTITAQGCR